MQWLGSDANERHDPDLDRGPGLCPVAWLPASHKGAWLGRHPNCGPGAPEGMMSLLPAELANCPVQSGSSKCHMGEYFIPQLALGRGNVIWA